MSFMKQSLEELFSRVIQLNIIKEFNTNTTGEGDLCNLLCGEFRDNYKFAPAPQKVK